MPREGRQGVRLNTAACCRFSAVPMAGTSFQFLNRSLGGDCLEKVPTHLVSFSSDFSFFFLQQTRGFVYKTHFHKED